MPSVGISPAFGRSSRPDNSKSHEGLNSSAIVVNDNGLYHTQTHGRELSASEQGACRIVDGNRRELVHRAASASIASPGIKHSRNIYTMLAAAQCDGKHYVHSHRNFSERQKQWWLPSASGHHCGYAVSL
jgi:hypothetical protein